MAYIDNGNWHLKVLTHNLVIVDFDVNDHFGIDDSTIPFSMYDYAFACCTFLDDNRIFYNFFERRKHIHNHFVFDIPNRTVSKLFRIVVDQGTVKNFPVKTVFNSVTQEIHCFYRQGVVVQIFENNMEEAEVNRIPCVPSMGETVYYKEKIIIVKNSNQLIILKQNNDDLSK